MWVVFVVAGWSGFCVGLVVAGWLSGERPEAPSPWASTLRDIRRLPVIEEEHRV